MKLEEFSIETIDCVVRHVNALLEQSNHDRMADFGEPCANCEYAETCRFDWFNKMQPLLEKSNVKICIAI